ncbi:hypothetical protein LTR62_008308 [Meristemomyces frigidus]|uniref:Uncharacterized protein n=1 Tax=Meristemomyces frigidus TaxID=1508187 RepID=A0AAN7TDK8_9PEZI|nr:hypothetical protein LTR62_008308 [Meristemomyces frigidus]
MPSFFATLMASLPAGTNDTQVPTTNDTTIEDIDSLTRRARIGKTRRSSRLTTPQERAGSFDITTLHTGFLASPSIQATLFAAEEQIIEDAFVYARPHFLAHTDHTPLNLTLTRLTRQNPARSAAALHPEQALARLSLRGTAGRAEGENPFYRPALTFEQATQQLQACLMACAQQVDKWTESWSAVAFGEFARMPRAKPQLQSLAHSCEWMSEFVVRGRSGWVFSTWRIEVLDEVLGLTRSLVRGVGRLVGLGGGAGLLRCAQGPLWAMGGRLEKMRAAVDRLAVFRDAAFEAAVMEELSK